MRQRLANAWGNSKGVRIFFGAVVKSVANRENPDFEEKVVPRFVPITERMYDDSDHSLSRRATQREQVEEGQITEDQHVSPLHEAVTDAKRRGGTGLLTGKVHLTGYTSDKLE